MKLAFGDTLTISVVIEGVSGDWVIHRTGFFVKSFSFYIVGCKFFDKRKLLGIFLGVVALEEPLDRELPVGPFFKLLVW